jgi:hypothetical protein
VALLLRQAITSAISWSGLLLLTGVLNLLLLLFVPTKAVRAYCWCFWW